MMEKHSQHHTIHLEACGGTPGCTDKLHMALVDFCLVIDDKRYRFGREPNGDLSILCINGIDETTNVRDGYKNLIIKTEPSTYNCFDDAMRDYHRTIEIAQELGCPDCPGRIRNEVYRMCRYTGEYIGTTSPQFSENCPFKKKD